MGQISLIGKNILGYTVSERLGSGAFSTVYKVIKVNVTNESVRVLRHVTIPVDDKRSFVLSFQDDNISKADRCFSQMLHSIISEIEVLNGLSENDMKHIVRCYEKDILVTSLPRQYDIFILMEYLTPLKELIKSTDFLVCDIVKLGLDILSGLRSCHNNGISYFDIKEDNIFISNKGEYKIGVFGETPIIKNGLKALEESSNLNTCEIYLGKENYKNSDDLYSLGILLYKLLNYGRIPLYFRFSEQFHIQDKDMGFKECMSGKKIELPFLGGEHIGNVIIKALSNSSERFQTVDEFLNALERAASNTSVDILNKKVRLDTSIHEEMFSEVVAKEHDAILGEAITSVIPKERIGSSKKVVNRFVFLIPVIILLIGVIADFVVIPNIYGQDGSLVEWLFTDFKTSIDILRDQNVILLQSDSSIEVRIFWWGWLVSFGVSLFFVGRELQANSGLASTNALLIKKEPYLLIQDVSDILNQIKVHRSSNKQLDSLVYAVKKLEEKLSVESDFGYGNDAVIDCENNIAKQLQLLRDIALYIEIGDLNENVNAMNEAVMNINSLLHRRIELKKH